MNTEEKKQTTDDFIIETAKKLGDNLLSLSQMRDFKLPNSFKELGANVQNIASLFPMYGEIIECIILMDYATLYDTNVNDQTKAGLKLAVSAADKVLSQLDNISKLADFMLKNASNDLAQVINKSMDD